MQQESGTPSSKKLPDVDIKSKGDPRYCPTGPILYTNGKVFRYAHSRGCNCPVGALKESDLRPQFQKNHQ